VDPPPTIDPETCPGVASEGEKGQDVKFAQNTAVDGCGDPSALTTDGKLQKMTFRGCVYR
jgi:hypothetical protein